MSAALPMAGPRRALSALGSMAAGTAGVLALLLAMNQPAEDPRDPNAREPVSFEVQAPPPRPKTEKPRPQPRPQRQPKRAAPPAPMLAAGLPGMDFGLPGLSGAMGEVSSSLLGGTDAAVMTAETVDSPPRLLSGAQVPYPPRARAKGVTGFVTLSLIVGADGAVEDVRVLDAQPPGVFDDTATAVVRAWRFEPGTYEGRAVAVRARQTLRFDLN